MTTRRPWLVIELGVVAVALVIAALSSDTSYDYAAYGEQWRYILDGGNPWEFAVGDLRRFNAYGPLHVLLAYPYALASILPKVLYALSAAIATAYLLDLIRVRSIGSRVLVAALVINPPLWILYVHGGFNDALVGALIFFGVVAYDRERFATAAVLLGLATLYKFIPIFIIPFLCLRDRRVNWRFVGVLAIVLAVGFGLGYAEWGPAMWRPLEVGAGRSSSSASIFNFLRDKHSPLHWIGVSDVDFSSTYLLALGLVTIFGAYWYLKLSVRHCVVLALSTVFLLYRANHIQFYLSLTLLLGYLVIVEYERLPKALLRRIGLFVAWLCLVTIAWKIGNRPWKQELHAVIGLPTFLVHLWMTIGLVRYALQGGDPDVVGGAGDRRAHAHELDGTDRRFE